MSDIIVSLPETKDRSVFDKKMPWDQRAKLIYEMFPSTASLDFAEVFKADPTIMGRMVAEIFKHERKSTGKPGKRPALGREEATQYLRQYREEDYTILPFHESLKILKGDRSIRAMAHKCGTTSNMMQRLLEGNARPTAEVMENVAKAFKRHPSYFFEYRMAYIVAMLVHRMTAIPEASIVPYIKLRGSSEKRLPYGNN